MGGCGSGNGGGPEQEKKKFRTPQSSPVDSEHQLRSWDAGWRGIVVPDSLAETRAKAGYRCIGDVMRLPELGLQRSRSHLVCSREREPGFTEYLHRDGIPPTPTRSQRRGETVERHPMYVFLGIQKPTCVLCGDFQWLHGLVPRWEHVDLNQAFAGLVCTLQWNATMPGRDQLELGSLMDDGGPVRCVPGPAITCARCTARARAPPIAASSASADWARAGFLEPTPGTSVRLPFLCTRSLSLH